MGLLIFGTLVFFLAHGSPGIPGVRDKLIGSLGDGRYRGVYVATSVVGMTSMIIGKATAEFVPVWSPPFWGRIAALPLMVLAFILIAALFCPTNIKRFTPHPMLCGIVLWSVAHLLANGDLASIVLFGGFGVYALYSIWSLNSRGARRAEDYVPWVYDAIVVVTGLGLYAIVVLAHPYLFRVPAVT